MITVGLLVRVEALPGKEADVESFLKGGLALVQEEPATTAWFAIRLGRLHVRLRYALTELWYALGRHNLRAGTGSLYGSP